MSLYQVLVSFVVEAESEGEAEALVPTLVDLDYEIDDIYEINESQVSE
jgi:hypothetical protein